jgi:hypothetical protein
MYNSGLNSLLMADAIDKDNLKKSIYRNNLMRQIDENTVRKIDKYHAGRILDTIENDKNQTYQYLYDNRRRLDYMH